MKDSLPVKQAGSPQRGRPKKPYKEDGYADSVGGSPFQNSEEYTCEHQEYYVDAKQVSQQTGYRYLASNANEYFDSHRSFFDRSDSVVNKILNGDVKPFHRANFETERFATANGPSNTSSRELKQSQKYNENSHKTDAMVLGDFLGFPAIEIDNLCRKSQVESSLYNSEEFKDKERKQDGYSVNPAKLFCEDGNKCRNGQAECTSYSAAAGRQPDDKYESSHFRNKMSSSESQGYAQQAIDAPLSYSNCRMQGETCVGNGCGMGQRRDSLLESELFTPPLGRGDMHPYTPKNGFYTQNITGDKYLGNRAGNYQQEESLFTNSNRVPGYSSYDTRNAMYAMNDPQKEESMYEDQDGRFSQAPDQCSNGVYDMGRSYSGMQRYAGQEQQKYVDSMNYLYRQPVDYRTVGMLCGSRKKRRNISCTWNSTVLKQDCGSSAVSPSKYSSLEYIQGSSRRPYAWPVQQRVREKNRNNCLLSMILETSKSLTDEQKTVLQSYKSDVDNLDLENITVFQLKSLMKEYGLNSSGKKNELIDIVKSTLTKIEAMDLALSTISPAPPAQEKELCYDKFFF